MMVRDVRRRWRQPAVKANECDSKIIQRLLHFFRFLGPGLITGAADDDPSGIATYSQVGAQFGLTMLWTLVFAYPLMAVIQEASGLSHLKSGI